MDRPPHRWPSQRPPSLPWRLPPARYQPAPRMPYPFPNHRTPRPRPWWRRQRARLRLGYLRWWQRLLGRLGGLPQERPQGPEVAALQLLVGGLLAVVLFQAVLLVLATR
jgi:hypothetical protein